MAVAIVIDFSFLMSSTVQKCIARETVMMSVTSLMYIMLASKVTLPCLSNISLGRSSSVATTQVVSCMSFCPEVIQCLCQICPQCAFCQLVSWGRSESYSFLYIYEIIVSFRSPFFVIIAFPELQYRTKSSGHIYSSAISHW